MTKACQFRKDMKPGGDSRETDACYVSGLFTREDPSFLPHGHLFVCSVVSEEIGQDAQGTTRCPLSPFRALRRHLWQLLGSAVVPRKVAGADTMHLKFEFLVTFTCHKIAFFFPIHLKCKNHS